MSAPGRSRSRARACCRETARWAGPTLGLALLPKCPACVAAYVAAATGVGLSIEMAARVRLGLATLCVIALVLAAARAGAKVRRLGRGGWHG